MKRVYSRLLVFILILFGLSSLVPPSQVQAESDYEDYRISGSTRYATAVEISKEGWKDGASTVVLAVGNDFPDALSGTPLAKNLDAPILLTTKQKLHDATKKEIQRLGAQKVIILGGTGAISENVNKELEAIGIATERVNGSTRYATSLEIAKRLNASTDQAVLASGENFADALAIAPYAGEQQVPIILTKKTTLPSATKEYLKQFKSTIIVGGTAAVSEDVKEQTISPVRISGETRYDTAAEIIRFGYSENPHIFVSTGSGFADALTGSVLAAEQNTAVLLVNNRPLSSRSEFLLSEQNINTFEVFGGSAAVTDETIAGLITKINSRSGDIGGAELSDEVVILPTPEEPSLEAAIEDGTYNSNGTIEVEVSSNSTLTKYKTGDLLLIRPNDENPQGLMVEVGKMTEAGSKTRILLGQPPIEAIFDNLKINVEEDLGINNIVSMDLMEGFELVTADGTAVSNMDELNETLKTDAENGDAKPLFSANPEPIKFYINYLIAENKNKNTEVKINGTYEMDASKVKLEVDKAKFWEAGVIRAFDMEFKAKESLEAKMDIKWEGDLSDSKESSVRPLFEGVDRDGRTTLGSITFTAGTIALHEAGMNKVPVGFTVLIVLTADGKVELEGSLAVKGERGHHVKAEWEKDKDKFKHSSSPVTYASSLEIAAKGEAGVSEGIGLDAGLNLFSLIPAIVESGVKNEVSVKGNGTATWDLMADDAMPTLEGCLEANIGTGAYAIFKTKFQANFGGWETGFEYNQPIFEMDLFENKLNLCVPSGKVTGSVVNAVSKEKLSGVKITAYKDDEFYRSAETDATGRYTIDLMPGMYKIEFSKASYETEVLNNAEVTKDGLTHNPELKLIGEEDAGDGQASGTIQDALNGQAIPSVTLEFRKGINTTAGEVVKTASTNTDGDYAVTLPAGNYTAAISKNGYISSSINVISIGNRTMASQNGTLSPILSDEEIRIILTWGEEPSDLDSYLLGNYSDGSPFHISYTNKQAYEGDKLLAELDHDDTSYYGPETVTILEQNSGTYEYAVHDFTNQYNGESQALSASGAKVVVYQGNQLVRTFNVPTNQMGTVWQVFRLEGDVIIPVNDITDEGSLFNGIESLNVETMKKAK